MITLIVFLTFLFLFFVYAVKNHKYKYWSDRNVPGPKPLLVFGNYTSVFFGFKSEANLLREIYGKYSYDYVGIYKGFQPVLLVRNPDIIKQILVKDFDSFNMRCIEKPISMHDQSLYIMNGDEKWKFLRSIFAPGMLRDRIEKMLPLIIGSANKYLKYIETMTSKNSHFEAKSLNNKYVLDVFIKLIFGTEQHVFNETSNFEEVVNNIIYSKIVFSQSHIVELICPPMIVHMLSYIQRSDMNSNILKDYITSLIEVERKILKRNSFIELLIGMRETGKTRKDRNVLVNINNEFIIQQTLTFFLTAYESTSSVMAFVLYELSKNEIVQNKCLREVDAILNQDSEVITMQTLSHMKYLQMVINETMRKHALAPTIDRKCSKKYIFTGYDLTIDKDVFAYVPVHGLHNDPKYFPNPELFDPERFSEDNKKKIPQYVYLPFGEGPRACIGPRLAKIVMLIGMTEFLRKYKVSPSKSADDIKYDPRRTRTLAALDGLWVKIEKRV